MTLVYMHVDLMDSQGYRRRQGSFDTPELPAQHSLKPSEACNHTDQETDATESMAPEDEALHSLPDVGGEWRESNILVIGRDDYKVRCSIADVFQRSTKLWQMTVFDKVNQNGRLQLDLPWRAVSLLVDSLKPNAVLDDYWQSACLDELVDVIELYNYYGVNGWNVLALEDAILRRLHLGPELDERLSRFDLVDDRYALKLRSIAQQAHMQRLVQHIDREAPTVVGRCEYDESHPRKWRKISANCAVAVPSEGHM